MTTLSERPTEVGGSKQSVRAKWFLMIAIAVLAVALVGLGTRAIFGQDSATPDEEIEQLLDNYLTSWETKDEAAVRLATTEDFVLNEYAYMDHPDYGLRLLYSVNDDIDGVVSKGFSYDWVNEQPGDLLITGDGPWFVSVEEIWVQPTYRLEGQANYTIIEVDGVFKIANHYWAGLEFKTTS